MPCRDVDHPAASEVKHGTCVWYWIFTCRTHLCDCFILSVLCLRMTRLHHCLPGSTLCHAMIMAMARLRAQLRFMSENIRMQSLLAWNHARQARVLWSAGHAGVAAVQWFLYV
mmetsp:Transcript_14058/g.30438  ORF Transcript_14058/g.30438 Transcript_14058/m.30438 type:complete len:113 (+) Transcript_14058:3408-3746(+)